jgi:hypothetical protein
VTVEGAVRTGFQPVSSISCQRVLLQHRGFYSFHPGRIAIQDSPDGFRILLKTKERMLVIGMPLPPWVVEGYEMIVFVLTYAVLALLVLSSVGSASAEIRNASVRVAHVSNCLNPGDFQVPDQQTRQIVA